MTPLVLLAAMLASNGTLGLVIKWLLAENKRLVAIATAPHQAAAHVAALDQPRREKPESDERPMRAVGS